MPGPKPKPQALKLLKGVRPGRINFDEPKARDGLPLCPSDADPLVKEIWDYTVAELAAMKILSPADRDPLYVYCEAVATHRRASEMISAEGFDTPSSNGGRARHPALQVQREAATAIKAFACEFGLTPGSRSTIRAGAAAQTPQPKPEGAARLLSG